MRIFSLCQCKTCWKMQSAEARALLLVHAMIHDVFDDGRLVSLSITVPNDDSLVTFQQKGT